MYVSFLFGLGYTFVITVISVFVTWQMFSRWYEKVYRDLHQHQKEIERQYFCTGYWVRLAQERPEAWEQVKKELLYIPPEQRNVGYFVGEAQQYGASIDPKAYREILGIVRGEE